MSRRATARRSVVLLGVALGACASPPEDTPRPEETTIPQELVTSLEVKVEPDSVRLRLHVTNVAEEPVELEFSSGQRFDFAIFQDQRELWRWSAARSFIQSLGSERIDPGATLTYEAAWHPGSSAGSHRAVGTVTASDRAIEQETTFVLPAGGGPGNDGVGSPGGA